MVSSRERTCDPLDKRAVKYREDEWGEGVRRHIWRGDSVCNSRYGRGSDEDRNLRRTHTSALHLNQTKTNLRGEIMDEERVSGGT